MGRALYRESGPSQDGDPVPGNLRFFVFCFFIIFIVERTTLASCGAEGCFQNPTVDF